MFTEFPDQKGPPVLLADSEIHWLCSLFKCHCKCGRGMEYTAPCVLCVGPLVEWAEGHIQLWPGLCISFHVQSQWENQL